MHVFDKGHSISYSVGNFTIKENLKVNGFNNEDIYYFAINTSNFKINFQLLKDYNKDEKIIKKIKYIKTNKYQCILPIYKNSDINSDIMCLSGNTITYAHDINDTEVKAFAQSLKELGYKDSLYKDKASSKKISGTLSATYDNVKDNNYIAVESYRGVTLIGNKARDINIFDNDVYKKPVSTFTDKYYIVADYNKQYTFKIFYIVNLVNGNIKEIRSYDDISFDTVMQGVVNGEVYFFDKDSLTQYKINIDDEVIKKVGNKDNLLDYTGTKWGTMTLASAIDGKTFDNYKDKDINGYEKVQKIGNKYGYYYLYKKIDNGYAVYRTDILNKKLHTYLFTTTDINSVMFRGNDVYFVNGNSLYYYSVTGVRKVVTNTEIEFNDDIDFGVNVR